MNNSYKLTAKVVFPEGVAPGAGGSSNKRVVAKNGKGQTLIRGTALAGVLRTAYARRIGAESQDGAVAQWFGEGAESDLETGSFVQVADAVIHCSSINERTHNLINRHTGAVVKGGLFSLEAVPPMALASLSITLKPGASDPEECAAFVCDIIGVIGNDPIVGGNSNRGIGRMKVVDGVYLRTFDLDSVDGVADFMDAEYNEREKGVELAGVKQEIPETEDKLTLSVELGIPRGEDVLVGDGQETDYALQPQSVMFADKTEHWRIPGSSLRGIFRAWMTRLAVRDGYGVCDSVEQWYDLYGGKDSNEYKSDSPGWGFVEKKDRTSYQKNPGLLNDPILDLFGSMYKKGRIHIADAFSTLPAEDADVQGRMHVAVDRFSGGANDGALFNNQVLAGEHLRFPVSISLTSPSEDEINWLVKTLRALHLGILAVGSSKSGGRLEIKSISAKGCGAESVTTFAQELK
ncbi:MAG: RAMP superfamily CRISPR-associated protein [Desulfobacterium sp.]|nr:RAMP superfamily CRISPR-associated protein [Desulfobacterium sp.]